MSDLEALRQLRQAPVKGLLAAVYIRFYSVVRRRFCGFGPAAAIEAGA